MPFCTNTFEFFEFILFFTYECLFTGKKLTSPKVIIAGILVGIMTIGVIVTLVVLSSTKMETTTTSNKGPTTNPITGIYNKYYIYKSLASMIFF